MVLEAYKIHFRLELSWGTFFSLTQKQPFRVLLGEIQLKVGLSPQSVAFPLPSSPQSVLNAWVLRIIHEAVLCPSVLDEDASVSTEPFTIVYSFWVNHIIVFLFVE